MTLQISDTVLIEGDPFSSRYSAPFPVPHPMIRDLTTDAPPRKKSSACWRGYTITWAIFSGRLHLASLDGSYELRSDRPLFAKWASTVIPLPLGNVDPSLGCRYQPVHEAYLEIEIERGIVTRWRVNKGRKNGARKIKGPPWQDGFSWPAVKDVIRGMGFEFYFETHADDRVMIPLGPLKEIAAAQGFLTWDDIERFTVLKQFGAGSVTEYRDADKLEQRIRSCGIEVHP